MKKKRILFCGEAPQSTTGNAGMMRGILDQVDTSIYDISCFGFNDVKIVGETVFTRPPCQFIPAQVQGDFHGRHKLLDILSLTDIDYLMMVGIDIWEYVNIFGNIKKIQATKGFKWIYLFPYDLNHIRSDWVEWIKNIDYPCVYSEHGYNLLKEHIPNITYFRPQLFGAKNYMAFPRDKHLAVRHQYLPGLKDDEFLFGSVGQNQIRKDPLRLITAFADVVKTRPEAKLYLHTPMNKGTYNLNQFISDSELPAGSVFCKPDEIRYSQQQMIEFYNSFDCYINCSLQEGLSWTIIEAMLCGVPFIASWTTAHKELLRNAGVGVLCDNIAYLPTVGRQGQAWVKTDCCKVNDIATAMLSVMENKDRQEQLKEKGLIAGKKWVEGCHNINELFAEIEAETRQVIVESKKNRVLFMQHASAGDILMTTRCLKDLKKRHDGWPLDYMTQEKYSDIVTGNPNIDNVIGWDETLAKSYNVVYNPHKDRILPGHWGRNSNSILSDFYWRILEVEPEDFFIEKVKPEDKIANFIEDLSQEGKKPIVAIYTTGGGGTPFRTYKFMGDVCKDLGDEYITIQLGGPGDFPGGADYRIVGLTFRQEAWVVSHAKYGIAVDTFGAHLLGALGKSLIMMPGSSNHNVVQPKVMNGGNVICLPPDYVKYCIGLGPCSGGVLECPAPCIGRIRPDEIMAAFRDLERLEERRIR